VASYTVAAGLVGAHAKTLVANTVDTVTFTATDVDEVEVLTDGTAAVYFTVDGSTPTVAGAGMWGIPAAPAARTVQVGTSGVTVVKVISAGTPLYSVSRAR
jgi:endonuclease YncB( thermonuclease family)